MGQSCCIFLVGRRMLDDIVHNKNTVAKELLAKSLQEAFIYSPRLQFYSVLSTIIFLITVSGLTAARSAARLDNR